MSFPARETLPNDGKISDLDVLVTVGYHGNIPGHNLIERLHLTGKRSENIKQWRKCDSGGEQEEGEKIVSRSLHRLPRHCCIM